MSQEEIHQFDQALHLNGEGDIRQGKTADPYKNMIGPYGGLTAALLLKGALDHPKRIGEPVSLTVNFAAGVSDGPFEIQVTEIRTNRSTQHWFITQNQGDSVVTTATAIFAKRRETWESTQLTMPPLPPFEALEQINAGARPPFAKQYDYRLRGGQAEMFENLDAEGNRSSESLLWIRDTIPRPLDMLSLTAMSDIFFPRIFVLRGQLVPAGTVSLTIYFHAGLAEVEKIGVRPLLGHARGGRFWNNYFDQSAEMWSESGDLLVTSSQIVYFKE